MSDFETEIEKVVRGFVAQVADLARRAALETLSTALGSSDKRSSSAASRAPATGRGGRRRSGEMDQMRDTILDHVKKNPGLRTEQLGKALGATTKELARPIRQLVSEGSLKTKGQRRGMQYFVKN